MLKSHNLYPLYEIFIENKNISEGGKRLMKISEYYFNSFKSKYENSNEFKNKIDILSKKFFREDKINIILDESYR